jgi:hypothetical protein
MDTSTDLVQHCGNYTPMDDARVSLILVRDRIFSDNFTWSGLKKPQLQACWIRQTTHEAMA